MSAPLENCQCGQWGGGRLSSFDWDVEAKWAVLTHWPTRYGGCNHNNPRAALLTAQTPPSAQAAPFELCSCGNWVHLRTTDWDTFVRNGNSYTHWPARYGGCPPSGVPRKAVLTAQTPTNQPSAPPPNNGLIPIPNWNSGAPVYGITTGAYGLWKGTTRYSVSAHAASVKSACDCGGFKAHAAKDFAPGHSDWCAVAPGKRVSR